MKSNDSKGSTRARKQASRPKRNAGLPNQPAVDDDDDDDDLKQVLCFGLMDPFDWAATLCAKLSPAAQAIEAARKYHDDQGKDLTENTDADAQAAIRSRVTGYITSLYEMLHSMPVIQMQPEILESLRFIGASIADIDRGAAPDWLIPRATKKHSKRLIKEMEWVPIITALQMLMLLPRFTSVDSAAKEICRRTNRSVGTIKDWQRKLYKDGMEKRPDAVAAIQEKLNDIRAALVGTSGEGRTAIIEGEVRSLLS